MMKIKCLLPQLSQPRCIKRIQTLQEAGYEVEVFGFDNGLYSENIKGLSCKVTGFGIKQGKGRVRNLMYKFNVVRIFVNSLGKDDAAYIFGIELAILYKLFFRKNKCIYEQADLNYTKLRANLLVLMFKTIDKLLIRQSAITVLTSQGFLDYLYGNGSNSPENIVLLQNKLHRNCLSMNRQVPCFKKGQSLKFGFVGAIRYPRTLFAFAETIGKYFPEHQFHFWGDGNCSEEARRLCEIYPNLFFHGRFRNPEDLENIYREIDLNIVCYDPSSMNVRIAEPNKLYESIFFYTPIVVSESTFLASRVQSLGVGYALDSTNEEAIKGFVAHLDVVSLNRTVEKMGKIPVADLVDSPDEFVWKLNQIGNHGG